MTITAADFFPADALLDRLTDGVSASERPVVFLVGSAVTAPASVGLPGVPGVEGVINLIRNEFESARLSELDGILASASNRYQAAFSFLLRHRGQNSVNDIVKRAVWQARLPANTNSNLPYIPNFNTDDETCRSFELDQRSWELPPATEALGALIASQPLFAQFLLTTNFDPLIEVAIARGGGQRFRSVLHRDGNLSQTEADGCHVVHLHGYWYGADTLHTPRQLTQDRPRLKASLAHILRSKTLVVCGYGGWDDVFTNALLELLQDDLETPEVIWTHHGSGLNAKPELITRLEPGMDRGAVTLYENIDCHEFLPQLRNSWLSKGGSVSRCDAADDVERLLELATVLPEMPYTLGYEPVDQLRFDEREQDRPPLVDFYVRRVSEAETMDDTPANFIFLTGIGGQGKSALAANYLQRHRQQRKFDYYIWRDCKEESERFEAQIVSIVHVLSRNQVTKSELSRLSFSDLLDLFFLYSKSIRFLLVFDNVDHYVDLEGRGLVGAAADFVRRALQEEGSSKMLFTCRPAIPAIDQRTLQIGLQGIDLESTRKLFSLRGAHVADNQIERVHISTRGHAFWLDLIAAQVARNAPSLQLDELLNTIDKGALELPVATLKSVWDSLKERDQTVLRALAETVRPISALQLAEYVSSELRWNQFSKSLRFLRSVNLIVVKLKDNSNEVLELHPLVRAFVRRKFTPTDQESFIESILKSYLAFFGVHKAELAKGPRPETIDRWIEAAEVCTQSGRFQQAFEWLADVEPHYQLTGHTLDFVRVADSLVRAGGWEERSLPQHFDLVFSSLFKTISAIGRENQCAELIEIYQLTIPQKDARYINQCDLLCYYYWHQGEYLSAIRWGVEGVQLKSESGVDTRYDSGHSLALAQRDSGALDNALKYFLMDESLEGIISETGPRGKRGGAFYGNIGRTLHLMGQIDNALFCYRKSAIAVDSETHSNSLENRGYIRQWVGELMYERGDIRLASACFSAARSIWELIAPPKARILDSRLTGGEADNNLVSYPPEQAEKIFAAWIRGTLSIDD